MTLPCGLELAVRIERLDVADVVAVIDVVFELGSTDVTLMAEDAAAGRPLLAVVCEGRLNDGMPARGFFADNSQSNLFDFKITVIKYNIRILATEL